MIARCLIALLACSAAAWAGDHSNDPLNPTIINLDPTLDTFDLELDQSDQADHLRFTIEAGETLQSLILFDPFVNGTVHFALSTYLPLPGFPPILLGEGDFGDFASGADLIGDVAGVNGPLGPGDYLLSFTMPQASSINFAQLIVVSRMTPAPGTLAVLASLGLMRRRR